MEIPKDLVLNLIRQKFDAGRAQQADAELPGTVDTEQHAGLLDKLGVDPAELVRAFLSSRGGGEGGQGGGGLGGALGKLGL